MMTRSKIQEVRYIHMYSIICFVSVITSLRMFLHNDARTCRLVMWFVQSFGVRRLHITLEHGPVLKSLEAIILSIRSKSESLKVYTSSCDCMSIISRLVHSFTCAGMLPVQYLKFGVQSQMGCAGHWFIRKSKCFCVDITMVQPCSFILHFSVQSWALYGLCAGVC